MTHIIVCHILYIVDVLLITLCGTLVQLPAWQQDRTRLRTNVTTNVFIKTISYTYIWWERHFRLEPLQLCSSICSSWVLMLIPLRLLRWLASSEKHHHTSQVNGRWRRMNVRWLHHKCITFISPVVLFWSCPLSLGLRHRQEPGSERCDENTILTINIIEIKYSLLHLILLF